MADFEVWSEELTGTNPVKIGAEFDFVENENKSITVTARAYIWTKNPRTDNKNSFYYGWSKTASTNIGPGSNNDVAINTKGYDWAEENKVFITEKTTTLTGKGEGDTGYFSIKFTSVDGITSQTVTFTYIITSQATCYFKLLDTGWTKGNLYFKTEEWHEGQLYTKDDVWKK